jgi:hypothetical protein
MFNLFNRSAKSAPAAAAVSTPAPTPAVTQPVVAEPAAQAPVAPTPTPAPVVVEEEITADTILEAAIKGRLELARQKKAAAAKAQAELEAINKMMEHTNNLKASFVLADNELVASMKAEANALAKLDAKVDERLAQEDSVLSMIQASNARMARLANGDLFAEETLNEHVWEGKAHGKADTSVTTKDVHKEQLALPGTVEIVKEVKTIYVY